MRRFPGSSPTAGFRRTRLRRGGRGGPGSAHQAAAAVRQGWQGLPQRRGAQSGPGVSGDATASRTRRFRRRPAFGGVSRRPPSPGPSLKPSGVKSYTNEPLYDLQTLRTLFLEFEDADWEKELADFYHTDVDVPAKLTVDGKVYPDVGVHFRGQSSYSTVSEGRKRSLDVSLHMVHADQRLGGYRSLNLLNSNADPTFLRTVLYQYVARQYMPAPKANWVRVVINGESWGIYVNTQQINSEFTQEWFQTTKGARWKVPGSPGARGGLAYLGDEPAAYKGIYEIKSKDDPKSWAALINLCKVLEPDSAGATGKGAGADPRCGRRAEISRPGQGRDQQRRLLGPHQRLRHLHGPDGPFPSHSVGRQRDFPRAGIHGAPRRSGDRRGRGTRPLHRRRRPAKALLYRLLAVPSLRARYLADMRDIAVNWLDWVKVGPMVKQFQALIAADVQTDTRKIFSTASFH